MSLSANLLYSLGVEPQLYRRSPSPYPTPLPHHNPKGPPGPDGDRRVLIPLSKFSYEQLWHFLQIEYPESRLAWPKDRNWNTIGQIYSYIRCLIKCKHIKDEDFQVNGRETQIQSYNYSPNSIDTIYPREKFNPSFSACKRNWNATNIIRKDCRDRLSRLLLLLPPLPMPI